MELYRIGTARPRRGRLRRPTSGRGSVPPESPGLATRRSVRARGRQRALIIASIVLLCLILGAPAKSEAVPVLAAPIILPISGDVMATYVGSTAYFHDDLYLETPIGAYSGAIFNTRLTAVGTTVHLGYFAAGTELLFRIHVRNQDNNEEFDFYTGPSSRNADGQPHGRIEVDIGSGAMLVELEDLYGIPEFPLGFNDIIFTLLTIPRSPEWESERIPEPSVILLFAFGGLFLTFFSRSSVRLWSTSRDKTV